MITYNEYKNYFGNTDIYDDQINYDKLYFEDSINNYDMYLLNDLNYESIIKLDNTTNLYDINEIDIIFPSIINGKEASIYKKINKYSDIINTIFLEIILPEGDTFNNLSLTDKFLLFNIRLFFDLGGSSMERTTILSSLFNMVCKNININYDNNKIQIPIFDFSIMENLTISENDIKLYDNEKELFMCSLPFYNISIYMVIESKLTKFIKFKYIIKGSNLEIGKKNFIENKTNTYFYMMFNDEISECLEFYDIISKFDIKALIIYFRPLSDDYIDYPKINSIEINIDGVVTQVDKSEFLELEMLDLNFILLPFSREFNSWQNIKNFYKNPKKYLSTDMKAYDKRFRIYFNYESKPDNFILQCIYLFPNYYKIENKRGEVIFS